MWSLVKGSHKLAVGENLECVNEGKDALLSARTLLPSDVIQDCVTQQMTQQEE